MSLVDELRPDGAGLWRVLAVRYATRQGTRGQHFLGHDERSAEPHPTAYYVWLAVSGSSTVLVDAGISADHAATVTGLDHRGSPVQLLGEVGVAPEDVDLVVLTHLHYDHTGTVAELPRARYVVQQEEWAYWTGPWARRITREHWLNSAADMAHLAAVGERLELVDGDRELAPGLSVHRVGGHTAGMQVVRAVTPAGAVVLASDSSHFYENVETDRPGTLLHSMPGVYGAFDRVQELADPGLVVPGHDPEVLQRHPAAAPSLAGRVALIG
ncbi:N-acyl homoserine lactonase family protein [Klenkia taihuensis]|uniref:Glyoxylase, beta-lactamase superfamily II n=1 Tax=Klenkia taihuensis TaxID=1225127 RepID=A0A1I1UUQ0_9ACTN|nr:N-acyl homoserine lactonase family protein [Klenkia taihuensis]GHE13861.1 MBL fold metallo-hydrolase [Klenkia taihuensis]SFD74404.1 Glyoxylase, beta-lactamase superfamily II [Klenkia taihuensis]